MKVLLLSPILVMPWPKAACGAELYGGCALITHPEIGLIVVPVLD